MNLRKREDTGELDIFIRVAFVSRFKLKKVICMLQNNLMRGRFYSNCAPFRKGRLAAQLLCSFPN
jgi:hypothetical protein